MIIKKIELNDGENNTYDIIITHYDGTMGTSTNSYNQENYPTGYSTELAEQLLDILKGKLPESLLLMHLNCTQRGSLHSMLAYQALKCPKSIEVIDNRTIKKGVQNELDGKLVKNF